MTDREDVAFYQLLRPAPQVAVVIYDPDKDEAFRTWLNDVYSVTPPSRQRWLLALFLYYGIGTGEPLSYKEVGRIVGVHGETARALTARGLRFMWLYVHTENTEDPEELEALFQKALIANEWETCDPSDNVSIEYFLDRLTYDGIVPIGCTPKTPTEESTERVTAHRIHGWEVNLWNPKYAAELWPDLEVQLRYPVS